MTDIQLRLLKMFKWFHDYCNKNDLTYYAIGGTMIGAVRHNGFIPWDDDIDIAMPREDYKKLISTLVEEHEGYILESPYSGNEDYLFSYSKLYDLGTTLIEKTRKPCKRGLYIDVFPLDGIGNTIEEARSKYARFDKMNMFLMARTCSIRKDRSWYKNISIYAARCIPSFFVNNKALSIKVDKYAEQLGKNATKYVANLMGAYRSKEITERVFFGNPTLYKFEGIDIYGPEMYDEYLKSIYGDWRKLPPEEKRYTRHDYIEMDLNKSFRD